ncbi:MAG: DUF1559 domain-containing protein [Armatimonadota bacterium]
MARTRCAEETQSLFNSQIIAILAAILFPVFARAREKARQTSCLSNVKQIGLGMNMYLQDYDESFPHRALPTGGTVEYPNGSTSGTMYWYMAIYPYINNVQIFSCPSYSAGRWHGGPTSAQISYGYNRGLCHNNSRPPITLAEVTYPAETAMIADTAYAPSPPRDASAMNYVFYSRLYYRTFIDARHNEGANMAYADGHAKWIRVPSWEQMDDLQPYDIPGLRFSP